METYLLIMLFMWPVLGVIFMGLFIAMALTSFWYDF